MAIMRKPALTIRQRRKPSTIFNPGHKGREFHSGPAHLRSFSNEADDRVFAGVDIVVVSGKKRSIPHVTREETPKEALEYLRKKGHKMALLAGRQTHLNAFLNQNLVGEVIFNLIPAFESNGFNLSLSERQYQELRLEEFKDPGDATVQLHYAIPH